MSNQTDEYAATQLQKVFRKHGPYLHPDQIRECLRREFEAEAREAQRHNAGASYPAQAVAQTSQHQFQLGGQQPFIRHGAFGGNLSTLPAPATPHFATHAPQQSWIPSNVQRTPGPGSYIDSSIASPLVRAGKGNQFEESSDDERSSHNTAHKGRNTRSKRTAISSCRCRSRSRSLSPEARSRRPARERSHTSERKFTALEHKVTALDKKLEDLDRRVCLLFQKHKEANNGQ